MADHGHAGTDRRNLALHRMAIDNLRRWPELRSRCIDLADRWLADADQRPSRSSVEQWREMLMDWPIERIAAVVLNEEGGQELRQCSPLAPALTPRERWACLREVARTGAAGARFPS